MITVRRLTAAILVSAAAGLTVSITPYDPPSLGVVVAPAGIASTATMGVPTLSKGASAIAPVGIDSTAALGSPVVSQGAAFVAPSGIASTASLGSPTVVRGAAFVAPVGIASTAALGAPAVTVPGTQFVAPIGIASTSSIGSPAVTRGAAFVTPTGIDSAASFGSPTVTRGAVFVAPGGIASTSLLGSPAVTRGAAFVTPTGLVSTAALGTPTVASAAPAYDTDAQNAFNAMTVQPSTGRKTLYNDLIVGFKADGDWPSLDWLAILAAETAQAGRVNLKNPAKVLAAANLPTFTVDRGFQGDGSSSYLDFGEAFNAAGNSFAIDSAHIGAWCNAVDASTGIKPHVGSTQSTRTLLTPSTTGNPGHRINDATAFNPPSEGTRLGHRTLTRTGTNARAYFMGGSLVISDTAVSVAVATGPAFALRNGATYAPDRLAAVYSGSGLTTAAVGRIHARLNTFLSAIGAT